MARFRPLVEPEKCVEFYTTTDFYVAAVMGLSATAKMGTKQLTTYDPYTLVLRSRHSHFNSTNI